MYLYIIILFDVWIIVGEFAESFFVPNYDEDNIELLSRMESSLSFGYNIEQKWDQNTKNPFAMFMKTGNSEDDFMVLYTLSTVFLAKVDRRQTMFIFCFAQYLLTPHFIVS